LVAQFCGLNGCRFQFTTVANAHVLTTAAHVIPLVARWFQLVGSRLRAHAFTIQLRFFVTRSRTFCCCVLRARCVRVTPDARLTRFHYARLLLFRCHAFCVLRAGSAVLPVPTTLPVRALHAVVTVGSALACCTTRFGFAVRVWFRPHLLAGLRTLRLWFTATAPLPTRRFSLHHVAHGSRLGCVGYARLPFLRYFRLPPRRSFAGSLRSVITFTTHYRFWITRLITARLPLFRFSCAFARTAQFRVWVWLRLPDVYGLPHRLRVYAVRYRYVYVGYVYLPRCAGFRYFYH